MGGDGASIRSIGGLDVWMWAGEAVLGYITLINAFVRSGVLLVSFVLFLRCSLRFLVSPWVD